MKFNFKRLFLIGMVMTLCVAGMGIGYGAWDETITISGTAMVESMSVEWMSQETNDPHVDDAGGPITSYDETILHGFFGGVEQITPERDAGWTACEIVTVDNSRDTIMFSVRNAYPGYYGEVIGTAINLGSLCVEVYDVQIDYEAGYGVPGVDYEVAWVNGGANLPIRMLAEPYGNNMTLLKCMVHILDGAQQGDEYRFSVTFNVRGPVEPPPPPEPPI
jgi:hypothetical protein